MFRFDFATVTVDVINLNDNPPQFVNDEGTPLNMVTVQLLEELPFPYTIFTAQVSHFASNTIGIIRVMLICMHRLLMLMVHSMTCLLQLKASLLIWVTMK